MRPVKPAVIDFETKGIRRRPDYPPIPAGVSIRMPEDRKTTYYAWGHPANNNCTLAEGQRALKRAWNCRAPLLFHNSKFDVDVAVTHMGVRMPSWERIHDTLYLAFLYDPHAWSHGLKQFSEKVLGIPPEERDAVVEWLMDHRQEIEAKHPHVGKLTPKKCGEFICEAPGDVVGRYANGDVDRTLKLYNFLWPKIVEAGMEGAYNRERELMPILLANEAQGVRVDTRRLGEDITDYTNAMSTADNWLRKTLKVKDLNVDSDIEMADALERAGVVTDFVLTKTGKRSTSKKNLTPDMFKNAKVANVLSYRNRLQTCLGTFMRNWMATAQASGGYIYTNWNQVRQYGGGDEVGARTGRLSSNPNLQNVPKEFEDVIHPAFIHVPELPLMRQYLLPDKGHKWGRRDYSQQEYRILAHWENDALMQQYIDDPHTDIHAFVTQQILTLYGYDLPRRQVKIINFGIIYGMGLAKLAGALGVTVEEAKKLKQALYGAVPGVKQLERDIKDKAKAGEPIVTWGGRVYYCEPPRIVDGHTQTFEYKLLNYLVQGSAGDCTKQAIINYDKIKKEGRFLITVHDEINISAPPKAMKAEMELLRQAMADVEFDVAMLSDGETGPNWADLRKFRDVN